MTLLYIVGIIVLVGFSAFYSATETAFNSVSEKRLKSLYEERKSPAVAAACYLRERYDNFLATILIGNDIVNMYASSLATVVIVGALGEAYSWVATVIMTVVLLVFGEIIPKVLAKIKYDIIAVAFALPVRIMMIVLYPVVFVVIKLVELIARLWGKGEVSTQDVTEEDLESVFELAGDEGVLDEDESDLVIRAVTFEEVKAYEIVTPRVDMEVFDINDDPDTILKAALASTHSRIPVCDGGPDKIIGIVHLNRLFYEAAVNGKVDLKAIMTPAIYVAKTAPLPEVIDVMKKTHQQLAIVVDSYGGTVGLLTMEDALEVLVGDIWDESDDILPDFIKISDDEYDIGASLRVDELAEELDIYLDEISEYYTTVGGWIVGSAEVEIKPGYKFDYDGLHFTVSTMDGRRIERIKLTTDETALKRHGSYSSI